MNGCRPIPRPPAKMNENTAHISIASRNGSPSVHTKPRR